MIETIGAFLFAILIWLFIDYSFCQSQMRISLIETANLLWLWFENSIFYDEVDYASYKIKKWFKIHFGRKPNA